TANTPMGKFCLENKLGTVALFGDVHAIGNAILEAYELEVVSSHTEEHEREKFMTLVQSVLDTSREDSN
ncbi:MAG: hypothetical protein ACPG8X_07550, partial [Candidatus Poseidoniaceae archaeon]